MANMDIAGAFDTLMESDIWVTAAATAGGYMVPVVLENLVGGAVPDAINYPETYGVAGMALGQMSPKYSTELTVGAGVSVVEDVAERFGVKETIVNAGA